MLRTPLQDVLENPLQSPLNARPPAGPSADPDALAWAAAVTAAGGTYTPDDLAAISAFFVGAKEDGFNDDLTLFCPLAGSDLAAAKVQRRLGTWESATIVNFVAGDYTRATGLTSNGGNKYIQTGLDPASMTNNSTHLSVYNRDSAGYGNPVMGSRRTDTGQAFQLYAPYEDGKVYSEIYNGAGSQATSSSALGTPFGHIIGARTASNAAAVYRNGASVGTTSNVNATYELSHYDGLPLVVYGRNSSGTPSSFVVASLGAYSAGLGLNGTKAAAYYTRLQALMTAFGRNV